ncbi:MAG TPA: ABC transporter permease, partial [Longimicrobiales bacterium]|nr:ABC transporter permease [Longimicrobiales bacterium]
MTASGPPTWAVRLLRALIPSGDRDFVMGDLEEEFQARQASRGRLVASAWFVSEGLRSGLTLAWFDMGNGVGMMTGIDKDLTGALRIFKRAPGFAAVIVLTLAIGIGGATAVYSVVRAVLLAPLDFNDPDRVVMLWGQSAAYPRAPLTVGDHNALAEGVTAFSAVAASWGNTAVLSGDGPPEQVKMGWVTPEYFDVVGVSAGLGRNLVAGDDFAVMLSYGFWVRRWGADPGVLGTNVNLPGGAFEVVGVFPPHQNPNLTNFGGGRGDYDVWRLQPDEWMRGDDRSVGWLRTTARLRDDVSLARAQAEVDALMDQVNRMVTDRDGGTDLRVNLIPVRKDLVAGVARTLWILMASVLGVLLIAASNVAHLMLARGEARTGEVVMRAALGGSRIRLIRQFLIESGLLALAGGLAGVGLAWVGVEGLLALAPRALPRVDEVSIDLHVLGFALLASLAAAVVFGLVPTLRAARTDLATALGERHATRDRNRQALSRGFVVAEVALSLVLLTATGLLLRSLSGLNGTDLGFRTERVLTFALEAPRWGGESAEEATSLLLDYQAHLEAVPGVRSVGFSNRIPLAGGLFTGSYRSSDMVAASADPIEVSFRMVTPGYMTAMGAQVVGGRNLRPDDGPEAAILDELAAARLWPGESALGRRIQVNTVASGEAWAEVVGVVAPMKHAGVARPAEATVLVSMLARAHQQNFHYVAASVAGDPLSYVEPLREAVRAVDGNAVIARVRTMDDLVAQ